MSYLVLRNCFVGGRYYAKGTTCELPDTLEKSPKNFQEIAEGKTTPQKSAEFIPVALSQIASKQATITSEVIDVVENTPLVTEQGEESPLYISKKDREKLGLPPEGQDAGRL